MTGHLLSHCLRVDFGHLESSRRTIAPPPPPPAPAEAMRALLASDGPLTQADLIRTSGLNNRGGLSNLVAALHDAGLVTYQVRPTYELKNQLPIDQAAAGDAPHPRSDPGGHRHLNALIVAGRVPLVVTRDDIEDHVLGQPQWHGRYARDTLQRVMNRLADAGLVERVQDYCGQSSHSVLTVAVRDPSAKLREWASGDSIVIVGGRIQACLDLCASCWSWRAVFSRLQSLIVARVPRDTSCVARARG